MKNLTTYRKRSRQRGLQKKKQNQKSTSPQCSTVKALKTQTKEKVLKAEEEKGQVTYEGWPIRTTTNYLIETFKARSAWKDVSQVLKKHNYKPYKGCWKEYFSRMRSINTLQELQEISKQSWNSYSKKVHKNATK